MANEFVWGVASAAYQIEGGYREDGKGDSILDVLYHEPGRTKRGDTGDVACDHYHRYQEDIRLIAELGVKAYRFSVAWSRVLPDGIGAVNEKGIAFYDALIDEMLKYGIEPYLTLYHWDLPQKLFERGGWLNPDCPDWFAEYATLIGKRFGDRVKHFITFNEPSNTVEGMTPGGLNAPQVGYTMHDRLSAVHNILKAHGKAVIALRETVPDVKIGFAPCCTAACPADDRPASIAAAKDLFFALEKGNLTDCVSLYSDPIFLGDYPKEYYTYYKDICPEITKEDLQLISQPLDFCFQNIYTGVLVRCDEAGNVSKEDVYPARNLLGWPVLPQSLYWGAKFLYERYQKPIMLTENGYPNTDVVSLDGKIHDPARIDFVERYLSELKRAKDDGVEVEGYFYWTIMDNLEWDLGYEPRFGLIYTDFATLKRIPKDSYYYYQKRVRQPL